MHSAHNWKHNSTTVYFANKLTSEQMSRVVKIKGVFYAKSPYTFYKGTNGTPDGGTSASVSVVAWYGSWDAE